MRRTLICLAQATTLLLCFLHISAQTTPRRCGTDERLETLLNSSPALRQQWEAAQQRELEARAASQRTAGGSPRIIPVVVHLIQTSAVPKISDARVMSQINVLNEDFQRLNADSVNTPADFLPVAANSEIQFCLASIDPNGCPTNGINRIVNPTVAAHNSDTDEGTLKGLIQWDPYKYLNIWVPDRITNSVLGYATFPTWLAFDPNSDGIVVSGTYFGRGEGTPSSTYDLGRTTTHEVGHWLGLYHTFQGGCAGSSAATCATAGDRCCDTPPTASDNFGCPLTLNTCSETPTDMNDMTANYMDYVDDACMNLFTQDQKDWFYFFLDGPRNNIWSAANLAATGCDGTSSSICAPTISFTSDYRHICVGQTVQFTDLSYGPPDTWNWDFTGGTPATSTLQHPTVTYTTTGVFPVTLNASNALGSGTASETTWIVVSDPVNPPLAEGFEGITSLPVNWDVQDGDGQGSWVLSSLAGSAGSQSAAIDNFSRNSEGTADGLVTQPINLKTALSAGLSFDYAYRRSNAFRYDSLSIWVSTDCGLTWTSIWAQTGAPLATVVGYQATSPFVPADPSQWRNVSLDLAAFMGHEEVKVKFQSDGRNGQWLYLDQVNLTAIVSREDAWEDMLQVKAWPNPSEGDLFVEITLDTPGPVTLTLSDATGRKCWSRTCGLLGRGTHRLEVPMHTLAAGFYLMQVATPEAQSSVKIARH